MKKISHILIFITLFMLACKDDNNDDIKIPVYAGEYTTDMLYTEWNPPLTVSLEYNDTTEYYAGRDSIDVNSDGKFDLIIDVGIPSKDTMTATSYLYPHTTLIYKNSLEAAVYREDYPLGLGQYGTIYWVDTLLYKKRIDSIELWSQNNISNFMWVVPPAVIWGSNGCWYGPENVERYIGIRIKNNETYKYGWIKVNEISLSELQFKSCAIEK